MIAVGIIAEEISAARETEFASECCGNVICAAAESGTCLEADICAGRIVSSIKMNFIDNAVISAYVHTAEVIYS